tara:strand:- start:6506 stop:9196 length:2691 start_codon:yes stop_codon:yes gene_type:complete
MYITLNSSNELSDSNFVNSFSEALVIKPNSYICLVGAGFSTRDTDYNLGPIDAFEFIVQYTYNGTSKVLTFPQGTYTLNSFCYQFNSLTRLLSKEYVIFMNPQDTEALGVHIVIELYRQPDPVQSKYWFNENYFTSKYSDSSPLIGQDPTTTPAAEVVLSEFGATPADEDRIWAINGTVTNNYDFLCGARAPSRATFYREPNNMPDRYGFELSRDTGELNFCCADGGKYGDFYIWDGLQYAGDENTGFIQTVDTAALTNEYLLNINMANTGISTLNIRKTDNTLHTYATKFFNPGDTYRITNKGRNGAGTYDPVVEVMKNTFAQVAWIALDVTTNLGNSPLELPYVYHLAYQKDYPCGETEYNASSVNALATGSRLCQADQLYAGTNTAVTPGINIISKTAATPLLRFSEGFVGQETIMPNKEGVFLQRFLKGGASQENQVIEIGATVNDAIEAALPTAFSICVRFQDDTALGGNANQILYGGHQVGGGSQQMVYLVIGSAAITLYDISGGSVTLNPLLNGTGAAMGNWSYDKNYAITVASGGNNNQAMSVLITDEDGGFYAATGNTSGPNGQFPNLRYIGSEYPPTVNPANVNKRMNGAVWDFRIFQFNNYDIPTSYTDWRRCHEEIAGYSVVTANAGIVKSDLWFYNFDDRVVWNTEDPTTLSLKSMGQAAQRRWGPVWRKADGATPSQVNWPHFGNLQAPMNFTCEPVNTNSGTLNSVDYGQTSSFGIFTEDLGALTNPLVYGNQPSVELLTAHAADNTATLMIAWNDTESVNPDNFAERAGGGVNAGVDVREQIYNICIENLPHRTHNGRTRNLCKSIYEVLHNETQNTIKGDVELINVVPPKKIWIPLNNSGDMPLNEFHVRITDGAMIEVTDLFSDTHIHMEIKTREEIF